jgi:hypothetical protein
LGEGSELNAPSELEPKPRGIPEEPPQGIEQTRPPQVKKLTRGAFFRKPRKKYASVYYVNILAVTACVLGILSLMVPWVYEDAAEYNDDYYGLTHYADDSDLRFGVSIGLIVIGAFLVIFVRFFGIVQLAGALLFASAAQENFAEHSLGYILGSMSLGFYVGIAAGIIGTTSLAFKSTTSVSEKWLTVVRSRVDRAYRVNVLSIGAAMVGIISIFLPWLVTSYSSPYSQLYHAENWSLFWSFSGGWEAYFMASGALFIFGSVLCFLSPLGGFSQLAGVLLYSIGISQNFRDFYAPLYFNSTMAFGLGIFLGLAASILALVSLIYTRRLLVPVRLFSINASDEGHAPLVSIEKPPAKPLASTPLSKLLRYAVASAIAIAFLVTPFIFAYAVPISDLNIQIQNYDQELAGIVVVYVDDEPMWTLTIAPGSQMIRSVKVAAGMHSIGIDEAIPGRTPENAPDGKIDWTSPVKVKPLIGVTVEWQIVSFGWNAPVGEMTIEASDSQVVVAFDGFTSYLYGQPMSSDVDWNYIDIIMTDGSSWISWTNVSREELVGWMPPMTWYYGSPKALGSLNVWLNVTDLAANGNADAGDFFTLETGENRFSSDVTYTLYIVHGGTDDLICKGSF